MAELAALLFDLDGTLVDTAEANYRAYAAALAEAGHPIDRAAFDAVATGRRWAQFLPLLAPGADHAVIAARKAALYPAQLSATRANAPLVGLARASRGRLKLALVTNASRAGAAAVLAAHGLDGLFDVIVTGDDVPAAKPAPDAYLAALTMLDVPADRCLAFEDSPAGIESARRAGIAVVTVEL